MKVQDALSDDQLKLIEAVQKINNEMHDKHGWNGQYPIISCSIAGYMTLINISIDEQELFLYCSANDDRIFYENSDKYEEWYSYIKRRFREVKERINEIKL